MVGHLHYTWHHWNTPEIEESKQSQEQASMQAGTLEHKTNKHIQIQKYIQSTQQKVTLSLKIKAKTSMHTRKSNFECQSSKPQDLTKLKK
jgi:Holliday junction resolvase RusA-like endonuclease